MIQPSKSLAARKKLGLIKGSSYQNEGEGHLEEEIKRYFCVHIDIDTDIVAFWKVCFFIYSTIFISF